MFIRVSWKLLEEVDGDCNKIISRTCRYRIHDGDLQDEISFQQTVSLITHFISFDIERSN